MSARFFARRSLAGRVLSRALVVLTTLAVLIWMRGNPLYDIYKPVALSRSVAKTFARPVAYPPDYEYLPFDYSRECTAAGDRILVTGLTPSHVSYFAQRSIAGGHVRWPRGWRSDPAHEAQSLVRSRPATAAQSARSATRNHRKQGNLSGPKVPVGRRLASTMMSPLEPFTGT